MARTPDRPATARSGGRPVGGGPPVHPEVDDHRLTSHPGPVQRLDRCCRVVQRCSVDGDPGCGRPWRRRIGPGDHHHAASQIPRPRRSHRRRVGRVVTVVPPPRNFPRAPGYQIRPFRRRLCRLPGVRVRQMSVLFITSWLQNLDVMWDEPTMAGYLDRLGSFSQVVASTSGVPGCPTRCRWAGCPPSSSGWTMPGWSSTLPASTRSRSSAIPRAARSPRSFAATYPERVTALVLVNTFARWNRAPDYPIGMPDQTVDRLTDLYEQNWGVTADILDLTAPVAARHPRFREWYLRYQRLAMPRGAAATMYRWVTELDVRSVLGSIRADPGADRGPGRGIIVPPLGATWPRRFPSRTTWSSPAPTPSRSMPATTARCSTRWSIPYRSRPSRFSTGCWHDPVHRHRRLHRDRSREGDAAWLALRGAHDVVRENLARFRGREIAHTGDGFLALFDGPARAVTCAAGSSRRSAGSGWRPASDCTPAKWSWGRPDRRYRGSPRQPDHGRGGCRRDLGLGHGQGPGPRLRDRVPRSGRPPAQGYPRVVASLPSGLGPVTVPEPT